MNRVLVIGIDGATWDLLMPLVNDGLLPNLSTVMRTSTIGDLESTVPPITAPAWVAFATGKNPGKTGVFDFLSPRHTLDNVIPLTSGDIPGKTLAELIEQRGKKTIILNLPFNFPPRTAGTTITSFETQGGQFMFPESLTTLVPEMRDYRLLPDFSLKAKGKLESYCDDIRDLEKCRFKAIQKLLDLDWDLFFYLFSGTDWIQHELYAQLISNQLDKNHPAMQLFCDIDSYLGWLITRISRDTILLMLSDHGFRVYKGVFYINGWLHDKGYLKYGYFNPRSRIYPHRFAEEMDRTYPNTRSSQKSLTLPTPFMGLIARARKTGFRKAINAIDRFTPIDTRVELTIDYNKSKVAYPLESTGLGLYFNNSSRFRNGVMRPPDVEKLKQEIIPDLHQVCDPITGEKAFDAIMSSEDIYWGEKVRYAPDIIMLPKAFWPWPRPISEDTPLFSKGTINFHSMKGIFAAFGDGIKQGHQIHGARIYDLAPTILHILGIPVPNDMDGLVIQDIFQPDSEFAQQPVRYADIDEKESLKQKIGYIKRRMK